MKKLYLKIGLKLFNQSLEFNFNDVFKYEIYHHLMEY